MVTVSMAEAKTHLSKIAAHANETGEPVVVFKNSKPWFEIRPLGKRGMKLPPETEQALCEANDIAVQPERYTWFESLDDLFDDLGLR